MTTAITESRNRLRMHKLACAAKVSMHNRYLYKYAEEEAPTTPATPPTEPPSIPSIEDVPSTCGSNIDVSTWDNLVASCKAHPILISSLVGGALGAGLGYFSSKEKKKKRALVGALLGAAGGAGVSGLYTMFADPKGEVAERPAQYNDIYDARVGLAPSEPVRLPDIKAPLVRAGLVGLGTAAGGSFLKHTTARGLEKIRCPNVAKNLRGVRVGRAAGALGVIGSLGHDVYKGWNDTSDQRQ